MKTWDLRNLIAWVTWELKELENLKLEELDSLRNLRAWRTWELENLRTLDFRAWKSWKEKVQLEKLQQVRKFNTTTRYNAAEVTDRLSSRLSYSALISLTHQGTHSYNDLVSSCRQHRRSTGGLVSCLDILSKFPFWLANHVKSIPSDNYSIFSTNTSFIRASLLE